MRPKLCIQSELCKYILNLIMFTKNISKIFIDLPRFFKKILALFCDLILCLTCVIVAFYLRLDQLVPLRGPALTAAWVSACLALPVFWLSGFYRTIFRYSGLSIIFSLSTAILVH